MTNVFKEHIASVQDFPNKGIVFRDITPLLQDGELYRKATHELAEYAKSKKADVIVGPEARGFIVGCPVAIELGIGFVPARKPHKLPREVERASYDLEYGSNSLEMHKDAIKPGQRVVVCDDLLATAGTLRASKQLIENLGGKLVGAAFYIELPDLKGHEKLPDIDIYSLVQYHGA
ncbi:adenine phosphoribosyltransferase [Lactobacillus sp. ESL0791]|uniref:adenine phosphoribosyltransferase n=1 Tax=Lactobacillus sp. ESL0791 TaxID=2983234 RepID=UPI0023FA0B5F|nr:adenine phosphoribosyltransferase [Lactobacillus sp. ESL0791]MDF7639048.1 adenine phosphoribosyltransferase [Lactobacillus sp. ESL0791]